MKSYQKSILLLTLACASATALAQSGGSGYYKGPNGLSFRQNDPFVFCKQGPSIQQGEISAPACWKPLPPYTGNWTPTFLCKPENYYGARSWEQADYKSLKEYLEVCPRAEDSGSWEGQGRPEDSPFTH